MRPPAWLLVAGALVALPARADPAADAARAETARQVVALVFPSAGFAGSSLHLAEESLKIVEMKVAVGDAQAHLDTGATPGAPKIDAAAMRASLSAAIDALAPKYQAAVADAFARRLSAGELDAMLAFFRSPVGAEAIRRRLAYAQASGQGDAGYVETPAEQAFDASPAGRAFKQAHGPIGTDAESALRVLWPQAMEAAESDYCAHATCGGPERQVFAGLAIIWQPGQ